MFASGQEQICAAHKIMSALGQKRTCAAHQLMSQIDLSSMPMADDVAISSANGSRADTALRFTCLLLTEADAGEDFTRQISCQLRFAFR